MIIFISFILLNNFTPINIIAIYIYDWKPRVNYNVYLQSTSFVATILKLTVCLISDYLEVGMVYFDDY